MKTTQPELKTAAELEAALSGYIGTEHYYTSPTFGTLGLRYTDGIRKMAELAGAYWLLDTIHAAAMEHPQFKASLWAVRMESENNKGRLLITFDLRDDGRPSTRAATSDKPIFRRSSTLPTFQQARSTSISTAA